MLFIFSIRGLKLMASPGLPEAGGPVSGFSPRVGGYFPGATGPLSGLLVPWRSTGGAPGRQTARRGQPACGERPCSSHLRVGGQGGGLPTGCARPPTFQREGTKPCAQRRQQGQRCPRPRGALLPGGWSQSNLEKRDFSRYLLQRCLSTCWKQDVLSHLLCRLARDRTAWAPIQGELLRPEVLFGGASSHPPGSRRLPH